ncbi:CIS tube protein [Pyxidicoccus xibeiensis]|uniref:CIS tube protein n=1 Tax=Pyxidicoccus xibeiensis TaxID=2906759 RepID=UPI0020A81F01|nr:LysM peptidoglycan-binding domain-containing protein [Pyxidicoccus xibeiensis]MCP3143394.1 LysM peptidoglycan-binding domain-containing protein [Pyxidicoccus xibeiensis]
MKTPVQTAAGPLRAASIQVLVPARQPPRIIPLRFNPAEYQLQKANTFQEIGIPGLESPPIQYVRGSSEKLSVEVLADTSDTLEDVREEYVNPVRGLLDIEPELHAPPIVSFTWDRQVFRGVLESVQVTYTLFSPEGVPLRAKMSLSFKEYRPVEVQVRERRKASPDFDKTYVVRAGDTLAGLAAAAYKDPSRWREIARRNGIQDPRQLVPGTVLTLPRLR